LTGSSKEDAPRGAALVYPGYFQPTDTIGVKLRALPNIGLPVKNNEETYFLLGTSVAFGKIRLFDNNVLAQGDQVFAAIYLSEKICCRLGDRFIIRRISPQMTIGGGVVLDWNFEQLKLKKTKQIEILKMRQNLDLASVVNSELQKKDKLNVAILKSNSCFTSRQIDSYLAGSDAVIQKGSAIADKGSFDKYMEPALAALQDDHRLRPWSAGMNIGELSRKLHLPAGRIGDIVSYLVASGKITQVSSVLRLSEHIPHLTLTQKQLSSHLFAILSASPLAAPSKKDFIAEDPGYEVVINFLRDNGDLIELKGDLLFAATDFKKICEKIVGLIKTEHQATASQIKDYLGTTRKYVIPLLEKLDALDITKREGDLRTLGDKA
jgi:selenocysteine-specific elongation factor